MADLVLIVEDDPDVRDNLALLLELRGYEVETACHGRDALERIARLGPPCLILLDLMMPVMDGWQLRAELLKDPALSDVPVVLLSGVADADDAVGHLDAVDLLRKPVDLPRLYGVVGRHC